MKTQTKNFFEQCDIFKTDKSNMNNFAMICCHNILAWTSPVWHYHHHSLALSSPQSDMNITTVWHEHHHSLTWTSLQSDMNITTAWHEHHNSLAWRSQQSGMNIIITVCSHFMPMQWGKWKSSNEMKFCKVLD